MKQTFSRKSFEIDKCQGIIQSLYSKSGGIPMASVTYDHVTKRFGDVIAVNDLDIKIADKEFLVLVGPSGCGKTTALRLLAGLEEITEGNIYIDDRVVNDVPPKDRDIAMVFQSYALYPHMSVYDNMAFGLKLRGVKKKEIDEASKKQTSYFYVEEPQRGTKRFKDFNDVIEYFDAYSQPEIDKNM